MMRRRGKKKLTTWGYPWIPFKGGGPTLFKHFEVGNSGRSDTKVSSPGLKRQYHSGVA
jgi:hypothetical protein